MPDIRANAKEARDKLVQIFRIIKFIKFKVNKILKIYFFVNSNMSVNDYEA